MDPLTISLIAGGVQTAIGGAQALSGIKAARRADEQLKAMEGVYSRTALPEFRDVEATYKRVSESGMEQAEVSEFMRRASSEQYARQLAAQTMAGGSLARYTLALNNAAMLGQIGTLAAQNFQRKMMGLAGYERQLGMRQQRMDLDTQMKMRNIEMAGRAGAGLSQAGFGNITSALSGAASGAMSMAEANTLSGTTPAAGSKAMPTEKTFGSMNLNTSSPLLERGALGRRMFSGAPSAPIAGPAPSFASQMGTISPNLFTSWSDVLSGYSPSMPLNTVGPRQ